MSDTNPTTVDVYRVLQSIDASLKHILALSEARTNRQPARGQDNDSAVASDADLDSQYGDPEVRAKSPKDWTGPDMKGKRFSECPPEYLIMVADRLDYFASQETDEKKRKYNVLDAKRARGWARRIRAGYKPPAPAVPASNPFGSDEESVTF